jgi:hypothetical protein
MVRHGDIEGEGQQTLAQQPAFYTYLSTPQLNIPTPGPTTDVQFDTELFDIGDNFNTGTYTFTAPVAGIYLFNVKLQLTNIDSASTTIEVVLNTSTINHFWGQNSDHHMVSDGPTTAAYSVLAQMAQGATAKVTIRCEGGVAQMDIGSGSNQSVFSGYLVA